jgi:hypothetical protein
LLHGKCFNAFIKRLADETALIITDRHKGPADHDTLHIMSAVIKELVRRHISTEIALIFRDSLLKLLASSNLE